MDKHFDVIIVGGGLVGLLMAFALSKEDIRIVIVERNALKPVSLSTEYQSRVSAISPGCKILFENLGLWASIKTSGRVSTYEQMFVWDSQGKGQVHFDCTDIAEPALGYIIENAVIFNALFSAVSACQNITILTGEAIKEIAYGPNEVLLKLLEFTLHGKLLIGADGSNSWVRKYTNIKTLSRSYNHEALVANVQIEKSHQKTAWQCFLPDGPLALLPLPDSHLCSIVWSSTPQEINRLQGMTEDQFNFEITHAFEERLGKIKKVSPHITLPLIMTHAKEYVKQRIALIGDAAHTIHPLAGQGVNLGFMDVAALSNVVHNCIKKRRDYGSYTNLREYERQRKSENWLMVVAMDALKRLFQSESLFLQNVRSLGLKVTNKTDFLKNQFIYHATGLNNSHYGRN